LSFLDITIFILCLGGLIYFIFNRIKYTNIDVFHEKCDRLSELNNIISRIENKNKERLELIKTIKFETIYDVFPESLIEYRDDEDKLKELKKEQRDIEIYLRIAMKYHDNEFL